MDDHTPSALHVADWLLEQPRSRWWDEDTAWVTATCYVNNVVGLADQDTWFSALVEVCDTGDDGTVWRSWLVVEWDSYRRTPLAAWWLETGRWRFFDTASDTGATRSSVFGQWSRTARDLGR